MYGNTESFINYCDSMMIVTENWKEYTNKVDQIKDEITNINRKINTTDDLKECVVYINQSISLLQQLKHELGAIKTGEGWNKFGNAYGLWGKILAVVAIVGTILGAIPMGFIFGAGMVLPNTIGTLAGNAGGYIISKFIQKYNTKKLKEKKVTQKEAKDMIDEAIAALVQMESELNNAIKSGARTKGDLNAKSKSSYHKMYH